MLEELFSICKVITPNSNAFSQRGFIWFHNSLVVKLIEPSVNISLNVFVFVICGIKDFEMWIRLSGNLFKEKSLSNFRFFNCVLFGWANNRYTCAFLD